MQKSQFHLLPQNIAGKIKNLEPKLDETKRVEFDVKLCHGGGNHHHVIFSVHTCTKGMTHVQYKHHENLEELKLMEFTQLSSTRPMQDRLNIFKGIIQKEPKEIHIGEPRFFAIN